MTQSINGDDLLDDLLAGTQEEADLAGEDDQPTEAAQKDQGTIGIDLDDLLAESMAQQRRAKQHKQDLRALRNRTNMLEAEERKRAMARVLEWEVTRVWQTKTKLERYDVYTCKRCLRQQVVFNGVWLEQEHKKLRCKRLVQLPSVHDVKAMSDMMQFKLDQLPVRRVDVPAAVEQCSCCTTAKKDTSFELSIQF